MGKSDLSGLLVSAGAVGLLYAKLIQEIESGKRKISPDNFINAMEASLKR